jgi:3-phosphoshikimate 1-carboxyvinyltransferase
MNDSVQVHPCTRLSGALRVPGDKSISHRLAMLSALAVGRSRIAGFLQSEDCVNTVKAMQALGAGADIEGDALTMEGIGGAWKQPAHALDVGNSGTSMRLLAGLLAAQPFVTELTGDASLRSRPMGRIKEPLEQMGAKVELLGPSGRAPVRITGGHLHGIEYSMPVASAQVKSCILLAGLFADGLTTIHEPKPTRDHTERLFQILRLPLEMSGTRVSLRGFGRKGPSFKGRDWRVPGDFSSAAFWLVAAAAMPQAQVSVQDVGLNPRRTALLEVLKRMGAGVTVTTADQSLSSDPFGSVSMQGGNLRGTRVGGGEIPNLIDELPIVAVAGALADGVTEIRDARELRVKESDRIACVAANLRAMGVTVTEYDDGMAIKGGSTICGGVALDSYGDHRIAMAMAILALFADKPVTIAPVACVETSYPGFWNHLGELGGHVVLHRSH